jgi:F0F1-type ATP synthase membrane subunit b/b'
MWILAAHAGEPPLIDIDGTLFVQLALFLILVAVLTRFLFKPYLALREERRRAIEGTIEDAKRLEADAQARIAEYEAHLGRAKARGAEERARIRAEGAARERDVVDRARAETARRVTEGRADAARRGAQARAELLRQADDIGRRMAGRLLGREVS